MQCPEWHRNKIYGTNVPIVFFCTGSDDGLPGVTDLAAGRPCLQDRQDTQAHQGKLKKIIELDRDKKRDKSNDVQIPFTGIYIKLMLF